MTRAAVEYESDEWGGSLDFNGNGVAGCVRCGWRGVPPHIDGERSTYCPACEIEETALPRFRVVEPIKVVKGRWSEMNPGDLYRGRVARLRRQPRHMSPALDGDSPPGWPEGIDPRQVGRNDPCPCGSGKKYKKCCLAS